MTSKFYLTQDEYKKLYSDGAIFNTGLEMNEMEGIWLAWETDPEAIKALLPPALGFVAPVVMTYIVNANTKWHSCSCASIKACPLATYKACLWKGLVLVKRHSLVAKWLACPRKYAIRS